MRHMLLPSFALTLIVLVAGCTKPQPVAPPEPGDPPAASVPPPEEVPTPREELVAQQDKPDQPEGPLAREEQPPPELGGSAENARLALNVRGHVGPIRGVFFTPDGQELISVGIDRTVQFWDVASGERRKVLRLPAVPTATALSVDGRTLALGRWGGARQSKVFLVNLDDGRVLSLAGGGKEGKGGRCTSLAFSPDGDQLAGVLPDISALLWDGLKGIWEKKAPPSQGRPFTTQDTNFIHSLAFSPDGKRLALGCDHENHSAGTAFVLEVPVGEAKPARDQELVLIRNYTTNAVAWSPDGQQVATATDAQGYFSDKDPSTRNPIRLWSAADRKRLKGFPLRPRAAVWLQFLNAEEILYTHYNWDSSEPVGHGQKILNLADPKQSRSGPFLNRPLKLGEPGDCPSAVFIDRTDKQKPVPKLAAFAGGELGDEIVIWKIATGEKVHHLGGQLGTPRSAAWSKDGNTLGFHAFEDDKQTPRFRTALDLKGLHLSADAEKLDRSNYLYRYRSNGDWSVKVVDRLWQIKHGDKVVTPPQGAHYWVSALAISPREKPDWVAWGARNSRFLILEEPLTGKWFRGWGGQLVYDLAPSPDGRYLLSVNNHQVMYLYRIADDPAKTDRGPLLYLFLSQGEWIMWTKEGYYAASPNGERLMGWTVDNGPDQLPTFHPAQRFHKQLYRPELIKKVIELGSVEAALKALDGAKARPANLEKLVPPKVTELKVDDSKKPKLTIQVKAEAAVKDQPVTALRLLVDGRPWPGAVKELKPGDKPEAAWTIDLPEGEHHLAVLARSPDASAVSNAVKVRNVNPAKLPVMHLLPIGINYAHDPALKLDFAAADAKAIADAFRQSCKGPLFADVKGEPLVNEKATRQAILDALTNLRQQPPKPNDLVVVFFAGHGVKEKDQFYLLPVDAKLSNLAQTALSGAELRKALGEFPCQVLLLLDACHAAAGVKAFQPATDDAARTLTDDEVGVAILCAAMGHEKAIEKKELKQGLFTHGLVRALTQTQDVKCNRQRQQYLHHIYGDIFDEVRDLSGDRQHPFLSLPWVVESFALRQLPPRSPGER